MSEKKSAATAVAEPEVNRNNAATGALPGSTESESAPQIDTVRTVNSPVEPPSRGRVRFQYKPDRHYVLVEAPSNTWDGDVLDRLLDTIDPDTNDFAYVIEARGEENGKLGDGRRITGHRFKVLLSCSKAYADRVAQQNSIDSTMRAKEVERGDTPVSTTVNGQRVNAVMYEELALQAKVPLKGIIG